MKKIALLLGAILIVSLLVVGGCAQPAAPGAPGETTKTVTTTATKTTTSTVTAPAKTVTKTVTAGEEPKVIEWNLQTHNPTGSVGWLNIEEIVKFVETASDGRLIISPFAGGALVPAGKEIDALLDQTIDISYTDSNFHKHLFPAGGLFCCMMGGNSQIQQMLWYGGEGKELIQRMYDEVDLKYVCPTIFSPAEIWLSSTVPIETLDDLNGYNMRVLGDAGGPLSKMGINTVMIPGGEVYESLQRGVIDGMDYSGFNTNSKLGFHEVTDYAYISSTRAPTVSGFLQTRQDTWAELPDDLKSILEAVGPTLLPSAIYQYVLDEATGYQKFVDAGVIIAPLPAEIDEEFMRLAKEFYEEQAAKDAFYAEVLESQLEWNAKCKALGIM